MKRAVFTILVVFGLIISSPRAYAMDRCASDSCCSPLGGYCKGSQWGWYGARRIVKTAADAENIIRGFFLPVRVSVANVREKPAFFEAEVRDRNNAVIDMVIVDKRTGRIRSIY